MCKLYKIENLPCLQIEKKSQYVSTIRRCTMILHYPNAIIIVNRLSFTCPVEYLWFNMRLNIEKVKIHSAEKCIFPYILCANVKKVNYG